MPEADYQVLAGIFAEITSNLLVSQLTSPISSYTMTIDQLTRLNQRQALVTDGTNVYYLAPVGNDYVTPTAAAISSNFVTAEVPLEVQNGKPVPAYVGEVLVIGNAIPGNLAGVARDDYIEKYGQARRRLRYGRALKCAHLDICPSNGS